MGPMLAIFLCSMYGKASVRGLVIGCIVSFCIALFMRMDVWVLVDKAGGNISWLGNLFTYELSDSGKVSPTICYAWIWPLTTIVTFLCGMLIPGGGKKVKS